MKLIFKLASIIVFLLCAFSTEVFAQEDERDLLNVNTNKTGSINIKYIDSISGNPVKNVSIQLIKNDTTVTSTVLTTSTYHYAALPGKFIIHSSRKGYTENVQSFIIYSDLNGSLTIYLAPKK